jgi:tRNA-splicing ligase RtcB
MNIENLIQISETEWEIPMYIRPDMRVPVRLFATRELLEQIINDKSLEQAVNAATLPGLVGHVIVMPICIRAMASQMAACAGNIRMA